MQEFYHSTDVPLDFTGVCKTTQDSAIRHLVDGRYHRIGAAAIEYDDDGSKRWCENGRLHRLDGPAIDREVMKGWYVRGVEYSEEDFDKLPEVIMYRAGFGILL